MIARQRQDMPHGGGGNRLVKGSQRRRICTKWVIDTVCIARGRAVPAVSQIRITFDLRFQKRVESRQIRAAAAQIKHGCRNKAIQPAKLPGRFDRARSRPRCSLRAQQPRMVYSPALRRFDQCQDGCSIAALQQAIGQRSKGARLRWFAIKDGTQLP
ncbi:MAG: hypothetical protein J0M19_08890, partial [Sphingomonadales bacterium]|nr:hypothetical protein [Sphingomonadales bacterium]